MGKNHTNFKIVDCGLKINSIFLHIGASPDGIVVCGKVAVEVKCPYTLRNQPNLKSLYSKTMSPLKQVNGQVWHEQEASVILSSSNANVCG